MWGSCGMQGSVPMQLRGEAFQPLTNSACILPLLVPCSLNKLRDVRRSLSAQNHQLESLTAALEKALAVQGREMEGVRTDADHIYRQLRWDAERDQLWHLHTAAQCFCSYLMVVDT